MRCPKGPPDDPVAVLRMSAFGFVAYYPRNAAAEDVEEDILVRAAEETPPPLLDRSQARLFLVPQEADQAAD